jgi:hypothetical protein
MARLKSAVGWLSWCVSVGVLAASPPSVTPHDTHANGQPAKQGTILTGFGSAVSAEALQGCSGSGLVQNNQAVTGAVTGDSAVNVTTGSNWVTGNAFSDASGLPSVIQNTGNNVLIQTGVIVNVQLKP